MGTTERERGRGARCGSIGGGPQVRAHVPSTRIVFTHSSLVGGTADLVFFVGELMGFGRVGAWVGVRACVARRRLWDRDAAAAAATSPHRGRP